MKQLTRNTCYNVMGQLAPLAAALVVLPFLISMLGKERYGVLSLFMTLIGYVSLFDLGLGGATTKYVSAYAAKGEDDRLVRLIWTALADLAVFGLLIGAVLAASSGLIAQRVLKLPAALVGETQQSLYLIAACLPLILATAAVRGVLEAKHRFSLVNAIRIPVNIGMIVVPLALIPFTQRLPIILLALLVGRAVMFLAFALSCLRIVPEMGRPRFLEKTNHAEVLRYGGWLTFSNIVGPLMANMDRFIAGMQLGMAAVTYYTTAYDVVTKLWIVSGSLLSVLFPLFSALSVDENLKLEDLFARAVKYITLLLTPAVMTAVVVGQDFLRIWLGLDFALQSSDVFQMLAIGVLACAVAQVPYNALQARGYPHAVAYAQMVELPVYLVLLWYAAPRFGIRGMAVVWLGRVLLDALLLFWLYYRISAGSGRMIRSTIIPATVGVALCGILMFVVRQPAIHGPGKMLLLVLTAGAYGIYAWGRLQEEEKEGVRQLLGLRRHSMS